MFYINLHQKYRLEIEFAGCKGELMPEGVLTSCTVYSTHVSNLRVRHSY